MNLERLGEDCTRLIKQQPWFPYKTGWLRDHATKGKLLDSNTYVITFSNEIARMRPNKSGKKKSGSEYITYLEEGTRPHDIQGAFGREFPFGVGGQFEGKFHPGSTKHKGFISNKSVNAIINYIKLKYNGEVR